MKIRFRVLFLVTGIWFISAGSTIQFFFGIEKNLSTTIIFYLVGAICILAYDIINQFHN